SKLYMPEDLHDFVFFSKNFDRASGTLVPFLSEAQVNYVSSKHNAVFPDDVVAAENTRVAFSLLLTAYSSGSPIKIMRCYGDGVVAFGTGQSGL
ncbi:hypothetical protein, partial [Xenorhabdus sp. KJ12.1]|uniref:hypothetical protein n=1 Tax=Xenorhabdus sp. KJ12.1 TaxID=1851571 RepID=UPI00187D047B